LSEKGGIYNFLSCSLILFQDYIQSLVRKKKEVRRKVKRQDRKGGERRKEKKEKKEEEERMSKTVNVTQEGNPSNTKTLFVPDGLNLDELLSLAAAKLKLPSPSSSLTARSTSSGTKIHDVSIDLINEDTLIISSSSSSTSSTTKPTTTLRSVPVRPSVAQLKKGANSSVPALVTRLGPLPLQRQYTEASLGDSMSDALLSPRSQSARQPPSNAYSPPNSNGRPSPSPRAPAPSPGSLSNRERPDSPSTSSSSFSSSSSSSSGFNPYDSIDKVILNPTEEPRQEDEEVEEAVEKEKEKKPETDSVPIIRNNSGGGAGTGAGVGGVSGTKTGGGGATGGTLSIITVVLPDEDVTRKAPVYIETTHVKDVIEFLAKKMKDVDTGKWYKQRIEEEEEEEGGLLFFTTLSS
jgi:uncharacterized spore protein YtfJ